MYKSCFLRGYQAHGNYSVPFAKLLIFMSNIFSEYNLLYGIYLSIN